MRKITFYLFIILCLLLTSCGGSGGGSDDPSGGGNGNGGNGNGGGGNGETVIPPSDDYLCFTANVDGCSISTTVNAPLTVTPSLEYSADKEIWTPFIINDTSVPLPNTDDKVYIRATGSNATFSESSGKIKFVISGSVSASGNIMSLLEKYCRTLSVPDNAFRFLFENTTLTTAPKLPATTLGRYCYAKMFEGCYALTTAPDLPATNLAEFCYFHMFYDCYALTAAPELPATTLAGGCYAYMFYDCSALTTAPALPATTLFGSCYSFMFADCSALTTAPELPATTLADACYLYMFSGCSALTTAPDLPATNLAGSCYENMFSHCHSLTTAPALPATNLAGSCYFHMFYDCSNLNSITVNFTTWNDDYTSLWVYGVPSGGTFICPAGLPDDFGNSRIPSGWAVVNP